MNKQAKRALTVAGGIAVLSLGTCCVGPGRQAGTVNALNLQPSMDVILPHYAELLVEEIEEGDLTQAQAQVYLDSVEMLDQILERAIAQTDTSNTDG